MIDFNYIKKKYIKEYKINWPQIPHHPYSIWIVWCSPSGKTNALLHLMTNQLDIDKVYLYAKDPYEAKY